LSKLEFGLILEKIEKKRTYQSNVEEKIADVLEGIPVHTLPLIFYKERRHLGHAGMLFGHEEQFYDKEKMLYAQLLDIETCVDKSFHSPLCMRPDFGTVFIPALLGLKYRVFKENYPFLTGHLTKDDILKFNMPDLRNSEMMQRAIEYIQYFKQNIPDWIHVYQPDTQGPFDIAHLIYGNNIFYEVHDDPEFVHILMRISTDIYKEATIILKEVNREPMTSCYHGHAQARGIYMRNGGVRISEDSATLISPTQIDEFVIPYVREAFQVFGGGFIHYCGKNEYLLQAFLNLDEVRAINLGNPEMYDFEDTMERFLNEEKVCFGLWPKREDETLKDYIQRMKKATNRGERGLLLHFDETMFPEYSCDDINKMWING
jgi:hypothetical protein